LKTLNKAQRKIFCVLFILVLMLAFTASVAAEGPSDKESYIVVMKGDPVIAYEGDVQGMAATKPAEGQKIDKNSAKVKEYSKHLKEQQDEVLEDAGIDESDKTYSYTFAINGFAAQLTEAEATAVAKQPGVLLVQKDVMRYKTTDSSPAFLGITKKGGAWLEGYTGENVIVGVIDTGIWPEHPSFADDGTYPPLSIGPIPCEFGNTAHNPNDAPFTCNNKLLGARQMLDTYRFYIGAEAYEYDSARDDDGHGTHTASTAAGNADVEAEIYGIPRGTISGIAPRARVIAYKGLGYLGGFSSDLAAAIDQAVEDGVDVINYSIGGGASLTGADDIAFLFAADAGVFAATSAGNSGPGEATVGGPGSVPWITTVGASTQRRFFRGDVMTGAGRFWGASITPNTGRLPLVDAEDAGDDLCHVGSLDSGVVSGKIVLCRRGDTARAEKSRAVFEAGGAGMILYNNSDDDNLFTDNHWVPSVHIDNTPGLAIKAYIDANPGKAWAMIKGGRQGRWDSAPSMTIFSSRGPDPAAEDIIKPDITAPGLQILAGNSPTPADPNGLPGQLFQAIAGTSMSSPHVAGIGALVKQYHPDWSPAMIKSAMMTTAYQDVVDNDRVSPADPFDMGAGHVDPGGRWVEGSIVKPGLVYDAGFLDYLGFLCTAGPEVFGNPAATCATLESLGIPLDPSDLNLPSIGVAQLPGSQVVQRIVTSVADERVEYTVDVDAPPGYNVSVDPSTIALDPGQSVPYEVTIINTGAPIGEWAFGSLTWKESGHKRSRYTVYSPIAVRGSLFDAPAEIAETGESGSASFEVRFGYTGDYTAAAHGLEPATVTLDNVVQDPDQNFDPNDGFSNQHDFALSGAAFFRIALPPESVADPDAIDLDVYVYDPNGDLVASSTNGGTDELVDITSPQDGTWSVYVHGWQTAGPSADYDLYSWIISATPGGNLVIDSAPTSATNATTGSVDVSWTGATAGQWHLGAVSHSDSSGVMGLTLIDVDNR